MSNKNKKVVFEEDESKEEEEEEKIEDESKEEEEEESKEDEEEESKEDDNDEEEEEEEEEENEGEEEEGTKKGKNEDDEEDDINTVKDSQYEKVKKTCMYQDKSDESSEDEPILEFDDEDNQPKTIIVAPEERITKPFMTKYEKVRILSDRSTQLARGAKPLIKNTTGLSSQKIAELELENNVMPLKIRRPLPNGKYEIWYTKELQH
jgi:DNA-directed RNA polymerase subunit K/omega